MPQEQPGERYSRSPESAASDPMAPEARIDINLATEGELLKVPGMTPTWARRILRFRPYRSKQDLLDSGVVSGEVYDRIRNYVIAHRDSK
jgi:DNA uptake protein ComE-like DNA-binding protein